MPARRRPRRTLTARAIRCAALVLATLVGLVGPGTGAVADERPTLAPDESRSVASQAAGWLAGTQLGPDGALLDPAGRPDAASTAWAVLALKASGLDAESDAPTRWLEANVEALAQQDGVDTPAGLSLLILVARAQELPAEAFGGQDLVTRLEATRRPDGLYGPEASPPGSVDPAGGAPARQGLVLAALGAAGRTDAGAADWLEVRQCPDGGWQFRRTDPASTCVATPETTGFAMLGLVAVGRDVPRSAVRALSRLQRPDGGFSLFGGNSDAYATAIAVQGLVAVGVDPNTDRWRKGGGVTPFGSLLTFSATESGGYALAPDLPPDAGLTARVAIAAAGQPLPLAAPLAEPDGEQSDDGPSEPEPAGTTTGSDGFSPVPLLAVGAGALVVVAGVYVWRRRRQAI